MDCFQILLIFLLASSCGCANSTCIGTNSTCSGATATCGTMCSCGCTNSCPIAEQGCTCFEPADCGCQTPDASDTVIEYGQTPPYPFPPYPVLRG